MTLLNLFDTITNLQPIPIERLSLVESEYQSLVSLPAGQVGTVVEIYPAEPPTTVEPRYLIEFSDSQGCEYAMAVLQADEVLVFHYELAVA